MGLKEISFIQITKGTFLKTPPPPVSSENNLFRKDSNLTFVFAEFVKISYF